MNEEIKIGPDDTWIVNLPATDSAVVQERSVDVIIKWCKGEGVRLPLVLFGASVHIIPKEET